MTARECLLVRLGAYVLYLAGVLSGAVLLSVHLAVWLGPLLVLVGGAVPALVLWRADLAARELADTRAAFAPEPRASMAAAPAVRPLP